MVFTDRTLEYSELVARIRRRMQMLDLDELPAECREILDEGIDVEAMARRALLRQKH